MWCLNLILVCHFCYVLARPQTELTTEAKKEVADQPIVNGTKVTLIPFYGGGKGQSLQLTESATGEIISSVIVKTPDLQPQPQEQTEIELNPFELENPPLPTKFDTEYLEGYEDFIKTIQTKANEIVKLQEIAKTQGGLTPAQDATYQETMRVINESARKLADLQDNSGGIFENREGLTQWFERKRDNTKDKNKKKEEEKKRKKEEEKKKQEEETRKKEEEKRKEEEKKKQSQKQEQEKVEEEESDQENESIAINLPPEDASVAEAKPIGLAVAGAGGVAASKPVATAVVGPGGLAIARPVGTAIAGVSPDQALVPIYADSLATPPNKKTPNNKQNQMNEFLNKIINKYHHV